MNAEIRLARNDSTPWGFRLTGGKDFDSPFFVVKVMGKSIAEKAGLRVGDLVWAINYKSTEPYTHKDSQRVIYESGNKLILNIRRGCPMVSGRGTPLPEYTEPLMEVDLLPPPVYPVQPIFVPPYYPQQQLPVQQVRPLSPPKLFFENQYASTMMETKYESTSYKSIEKSEQMIKERVPAEPEDDDMEEGEDVESSWNITIKPSGKIIQIEEVETPPSSCSSRASSRSRKSRSRSPSRERRKSLTKPILKTSSESPKLIANFSSEILDNENVSVETSTKKLSTERKLSAVSVSSAEETKKVKGVTEATREIKDRTKLTNEDIAEMKSGEAAKKVKEVTEAKKEIKDKTQLTDEDIAEMMSGEAEVLDQGVIGVNFQKFIPKVDFIKDSQVLQALQEEHFHKEEPEEKQLEKEPTKRFSTFLQTPKRPIPKPKPRQDNVEDLPWKRKLLSPTPNAIKQQKVNDTQQQQQSEDEKEAVVTSASQNKTSEKADVTEEMSTEESEDTRIKDVQEETEISTTEEEQKLKVSEIEESVTCDGDVTSKTTGDVDEDDEKKSVRFKDEIQKHEIEEVESAVEEIHKSIMLDLESCKDDFERQLAHIQHQLSSMQNMPEEIKMHLLDIQQQLFNIVKMKTAAEQEKAEREKRLREEEEEEEKRKTEEKADHTDENIQEPLNEGTEKTTEEPTNEDENQNIYNQQEVNSGEETTLKSVDETALQITETQDTQSVQQSHGVEYAVAPKRKKEILQTPQVRPIILPGGRKWRKPQDAYTDEFIAETLVGQSEVIVGTTIGVNFWKYIPPKFDTSNSAVYRLIQENENRCKGIAGRPEKVLAEEDYYPAISKRHFYAAKLAEMAQENAAQQPLEPGA